jgi:hypothetical protein
MILYRMVSLFENDPNSVIQSITLYLKVLLEDMQLEDGCRIQEMFEILKGVFGVLGPIKKSLIREYMEKIFLLVKFKYLVLIKIDTAQKTFKVR